MLTSKQRAELRAQANTLETTLMVGKGGVTEQVVAEAKTQLAARELVKGRVLEAALLSAREASDELCAALGAEGIQTVGSKFIIYKKSEKKTQEAARAARMLKKKAENPVRRGAQERRRQAKEMRESLEGDFEGIGVLPFRLQSTAGTERSKPWRESVFSAEASIRPTRDIFWRSGNSSAGWNWISSLSFRRPTRPIKRSAQILRTPKCACF